ncbi:MAG: hypothetical protein CMH22_05995 [Methylophaga sp.]|nr:hypothetical protein [Methylophaga sp.]|tara:strand:+ start:62950 stop:63189 length:240 start_codon:yes stop_codon:yes gene_type:complete
MKVFALVGTNNKATVVTESGESKLFSYNTEVASYDHLNNKMTINGWYSATTARHINAFLDFYGFDKMNKKQILEAANGK